MRKETVQRDWLRKCYTRLKDITKLQGVASRNLNSIETAEKAIKDLFDEYADLKYSSSEKELKIFIEENKGLKAKIYDLEAMLSDKKAIISELTIKNSELGCKNRHLNDKKLELNEDIAYYKKTLEVMNKEIKVLTEKNKFLKKPWYARLFSL